MDGPEMDSDCIFELGVPENLGIAGIAVPKAASKWQSLAHLFRGPPRWTWVVLGGPEMDSEGIFELGVPENLGIAAVAWPKAARKRQI